MTPADEIASLRAQGIELVMVGTLHARDPATGRRLFSLDEDEREWTAEMLGADDGQRLVLEAARQRILAVMAGRVAPDGRPSRDGPA